MDKISKFVINLKKRPDRLKLFSDSFPLTDFQIVYGFNGKDHKDESEKEIQIYNTFKIIRPGERGCFISHLRIYKKIIDENIDYAIILEDDAIFCDKFNEKLEIFFNELPKDFNIAYIGGSFNKDFIMNSKNCISLSPNVDQHPNFDENISKMWVNVEHDRTTHAYIISNKGANILINEYKINPEINIAIDHWLLHVFFKNKIKIYNSRPLLCYSPLFKDSDIR